MKRVDLVDFFRNPERAAYRVSPEGSHVSFLAPYQGRLNVFVQEREGGSVQQITQDTNRDIIAYLWASNNRILYLQDVGGDENHKLFGVDRDGSNVVALTDFDGVKTIVIDDLKDDDRAVIIGLNKKNRQAFDPYRLDVVTGELEQLAENPGNVVSWMTDHAGLLRLAVASDGVNTHLMHRASEDAPFEVILSLGFKDQLRPLLFTFDNVNLYAASNLGRDKTALVEFDLEQREEVREIYAHPDYDIAGVLHSEHRKCLTAVTFVSWKSEWRYLDSEAEQMHARFAEAVGESDIEVTDWDHEEKVFVARTQSDRSRGAYYLYETKSGAIRKLADLCPWLDEEDMASVKPIEYVTRDRLTIHGYLTLPQERPAGSLPTVIYVHGGPWHRDTWLFDPTVQFLANRGYAVLQVNFRGSTGYGKRFWEASFKQWGLKMQDDITDGVRWAIEQGIADPARIAIYGGSYGGYATLAGLAFTPDLYACGVDYVGVSNLLTFLNSIPAYWEPLREMLYEMVGHPERDRSQLEATSPARYAERIKVPLLIAQGANDPRVNKNESDQMVRAMRDRGVEVEYIVKDNEGHGFLNEENRFEFFRAMERFLAKHLGDENTDSGRS